MSVGPTTLTSEVIDLPRLEKTLRSPRTLFSYCMSALTGAMAIIALIPLFSVLIMLLYEGGQRISIELFVELPPAAKMVGGGIGNAIQGTLLIVAIATLISVPIGILAAVYLAEFGPQSRTATAVRFVAKVLTGLPRKMREAAVGMGATRTQAVWYVILPAAFPGILTGVMLAVARAAGETAPLLFTALNNQYWNVDPRQPTASLTVQIFNYAISPYQDWHDKAWGAALTLLVLIGMLSLIARFFSRKRAT